MLHFTYNRFDDLKSRRDRCDCAPTEEDAKRCFILPFDRMVRVLSSALLGAESKSPGHHCSRSCAAAAHVLFLVACPLQPAKPCLCVHRHILMSWCTAWSEGPTATCMAVVTAAVQRCLQGRGSWYVPCSCNGKTKLTQPVQLARARSQREG